MTIEEIYQLYKLSEGINTDTRKTIKESIFFALKGPSFNGNLYAKTAVENGAIAVIIDEHEFFIEGKTILVNNVLDTLQQLALHHRRQLKCPVIAITGSNGKTTTKELLSAILSTTFKTYSTQGNLNNHIGVPLTLLSIPDLAEIVVIELGANHLLENKFLCEIAHPDYGIITNNGKDHLEGYGSLEGVRKGNGEVYEFLKENNAVAFVSANQQDLMEQSTEMKRLIYGAHDDAVVKAEVVNLFPHLHAQLTFIDGESFFVKTQLVGKYNIENILAAAAIGFHFKVKKENIILAIENYKPANNRSQQQIKDGNYFIMDAYNANPTSMKLALENFAGFPVENKIAVLGSMAELGKYSAQEHTLILNQLDTIQLKETWLVGTEFSEAVKDISSETSTIKLFSSIDELKKHYQQRQLAGYYFLLKGSRIHKLEKLLE